MKGRGWLVAVAASVSVAASCSDGGNGQTAFCRAASDTSAYEDVFDSLDATDVPAAIEAFTEARDVEIRIRRDAPEAIRADLDLLVQFFDDLVEGLEDVDPEAPGRPPVYEEARTRNDEIEAASRRIQTYVETNCERAEE